MIRSKLIVIMIVIIASFFAGYLYREKKSGKIGSAGERQVLYYVDPMNPVLRSDKPGIAPCGMDFKPIYAGDEDLMKGNALPPGTVLVNPDRQQLIGVKVALAEKAPWSYDIRVLGRVVPDETRIYRINSATDGWIMKILPVTTDSLVKKDELLATFYAPEFFSAIKAYLYGIRSLDRFQKSGMETKEQIEQTGGNLESYRNSLRNLGMSEHQMDDIMKTQKSPDNIEIRAPEAGFVLVRNLTLGERFARGTELYRIADLAKVWIVADVFETEGSSFKPGLQARISAPNLNKTFIARVTDVLPRFDPASRTLKVRLEVDNPGYFLRPDMFVDVDLPIRLPSAVTVPLDAVLDSGLRKTVFVDRGNGYFEPRKVETGRKFGERVEIVKGLDPGERVVISGNFLIDSESRMKTASTGPRLMSIDPTCGHAVDAGEARAAGRMSEYRGTTYYFCSSECKQAFDKDPDRALSKTAQRMDQPASGGSRHD